MICPYFIFYHNEIICQCVQDKTDCCGILENCENEIGRISYLQDKEEGNDKSK